jgi:hypothetical protein
MGESGVSGVALEHKWIHLLPTRRSPRCGHTSRTFPRRLVASADDHRDKRNGVMYVVSPIF